MNENARYAVGIDLGTTHCALSWVDVAESQDDRTVQGEMPIPQLTGPGAVEERPLLPSFLYLPHPEELARDDLKLAWEVKPHQREMLCSAASNGSKSALETMIALGFELSDPGGRAPLHEAAWRGDVEVAELLINAGADPLMTEPAHSAAPIGFAVFARQHEMVEYLRQFGEPE